MKYRDLGIKHNLKNSELVLGFRVKQLNGTLRKILSIKKFILVCNSILSIHGVFLRMPTQSAK
jgi:hypothetical protein